MGYCVDMDTLVGIPANKIQGAIDALRDMHKEENQPDWSWVDGDSVLRCLEAGDLVGAMSLWRYECVIDPDTGSLRVIWFEGEKLGHDSELWTALAPFIPYGCEIKCRGEDDSMWRWYFTGEEMIEQEAKVFYE